MILNWREDEDAPAPGDKVGPVQQFAAEGAHFVDIGDFAMLVVRHGRTLTAFWNLCPHQFLPLNWRSDIVLSADGVTLRCSNHGAAFGASDGAPADGGSMIECGLSQIPVRVEGDAVLIGEG